MKLTREQRAKFFRGELPRISYPSVTPKLRRPKACPVEVGDSYRLSSHQELVVVKVRRSRRGDYVVFYELKRRGRAIWMAQSAPKATTEEDRGHFTEEQARGYTQSRSRALDPEVEAVYIDGDNDPIVIDARKRFAEHMETERSTEVAEQRGKQLTRRLRRLQTDAAKEGIDIAPRLISMLKEAEDEVAKQRAA